MKRTRWLPFLVLAMAVAGLIVTVMVRLEFSWLGFMLLSAATATSASVRQMGPLRQASLADPADEREQAWCDRANLNAFGTVAVLAMLLIGGFGGWMLWAGFAYGRGATPLDTGMALIAIALFLFALFMTLPTLYASWTLPEIIGDEPEERLSFLKTRRPAIRSGSRYPR